MDKFVQPYDKECMKMAMLKHEETFKEQVYELHRLYQIQKILMNNMQRSRHNLTHQENISYSYQQQKNMFDLKQPTTTTKEYEQHVKETLHDQETEDYECEIELTLAPTSFNRRRRTTNKPESSDSVPSFSSSSTASNHIKRVERIARDQNSSFMNGNKRNNNSSSDRSLQQQPPWMYQVLSLKMT